MNTKATAKINFLKNEYSKLESVDREKIDKLKKQYLEQKKLWETVRIYIVWLLYIENSETKYFYKGKIGTSQCQRYGV